MTGNTTANKPALLSEEAKLSKQRRRLMVVEVFTIILFLLYMIPFVVVVFSSGKTSGEIMQSPFAAPLNYFAQLKNNVTRLFSLPNVDYIGAFQDSFLITVGSLILIVLASSMAAWVITRVKGKLSTFIYMLFVSAMVIPFQVVMFPLVQWFKMIGDAIGIKLLSSFPGIFFAYLGFGAPLSIFILSGFIKTIPLSLEEAATIDGCSQPRIFFNIVYPLLLPVVVTVLILNGIWIWNDYLLPLLLLGPSGEIQTMPLAVTAFVGAYVKQWDLILTSTLIVMLPIVILFIFAQKYIMKGMVEGSVK